MRGRAVGKSNQELMTPIHGKMPVLYVTMEQREKLSIAMINILSANLNYIEDLNERSFYYGNSPPLSRHQRG